ncbi:MAG: DUF4349 domain-containing protein [Clostridiales bacterium]|nr:DUF4349 domain-containing protein [Clostridiales bacterium]
MQNDNHHLQDHELEQALSRLYTADVPNEFHDGWRAAVRREEIILMNKKPTRNRFWKAAAPVFAALVLVTGSLWAGTLDLAQNGLEAGVQMAQTNAAVEDSYEYAYVEGASSNTASYSKAMVNNIAPMSAGGSMLTGGTMTAEDTDRKLVRTADVTVRSTAFDQDVQSVQTLLAEVGGYVENLYQYGDSQNDQERTMSLSMRVPSDKLDQFLTGMNGIGRMTNRSEGTQDMTVQYADNEARLQTLKDKMTRLNELLAKAENVSDLVEIESAIADTQYQIDSYETSQRSIDRRVDMSAVNVTVAEETTAQSAAADDMSLGERIKAGLNASTKGLVKFLRNMVVFLVMALPVLVPAAVIAVVVWLIKRRKKADN